MALTSIHDEFDASVVPPPPGPDTLGWTRRFLENTRSTVPVTPLSDLSGSDSDTLGHPQPELLLLSRTHMRMVVLEEQ